MRGIFYLFLGIFSIVFFSSFISSEAQSDPRVYFGSPTVAQTERQIIVYSDSSKINGNVDAIKTKVQSVNPDTGVTETITVWIKEIDDTGDFTGALVRFASGSTDGTNNKIHADIGNDIRVYIPHTSIEYWGKVVSPSGGSPMYNDARFDEDYSDCENFPNPSNPDDSPDKDEDGICDVWETGDKLVITYLGSSGVANYTYNCDPVCDNTKKDIFVEIDFMQGHGPTPLIIDQVKEAFSNANVEPGNGIRLHVQVDEFDSQFIPHEDETRFPGMNIGGLKGFDQIKASYFGTVTERDDLELWDSIGWNQKRQAFHYGLFVHNQAQSDSSGIAEIFGNDVMISLGSFNGQIGNLDQQAGTLMHELGHNLNLSHGGGDDINCKPNYLSVMSYSRQFNELGAKRALDFSNATLGTMSGPDNLLNETSLFENQGIGWYGDRNNNKIIFNNVLENTAISKTNSACVNWDPSTTCGANPDTPIDFDINSIRAKDGVYLCNDPTLQELYGYDDWTNLQLDSRGTGGFDDGVPSERPGGPRTISEKCPPPLPQNVPENVRDKYRSCVGGVAEGVTKASQVSSEMTYRDVQTMRVIQLDIKEEFIKKLLGASSEKEYQIMAEELSPIFQDARKKIRTDDMRGVIDVISELRETLDTKVSGSDREIAKRETTELIDSYAQTLQILDPTIDKVPSPQKQIDAKVSYKNIECNRGLVLMVNEKLQDAICVTEQVGIYFQSLDPEIKWADYKFP